MDIRIILNPGDIGSPPNQSSMKFSTAHRRTQIPLELGPTRRQSLRSSSHTLIASEIPKAHNLPNIRTSKCQPPIRLSSPHAAISSCSHRRNLRSATHSSAANEDSKAQVPCRRVHRRLSQQRQTPVIPIPSPASLLLSQARQSIELETDWLGRKPCIMDVILDLKSPVAGYENTLMSSQRSPLRREYDFTDRQSLDVYWADQATLWDGVWSPGNLVTRFPDSTERSTVSWASSLNDGPETCL